MSNQYFRRPQYNPQEPRGSSQAMRALITTMLEKCGFECLESIDRAGDFYTGNDANAEDRYQDHLIIDAEDLQSLIDDEYIDGVEIIYDEDRYPWISTDNVGLRPTMDGLYAYFIGTTFSNLDRELVRRCEDLVVQGRWDTAIREAMLVVETRLRTLSGLSGYGVSLVNECFRQNGALSNRFEDESMRQNFRDLFAGTMGLIRNDYAHNFRTPGLFETITILRLAEMLLDKLDSLQ